ncbi:MAG: Holliday junction branch migration DNA helicase RuvB [Spirochaetia bacterium]|nr:Holliday junction branch migration DNA helicase RuvB [Spirochaetia bacterium]MCF7946369.1 Holliday junction branch migration DNA helicase RuvB [Spirochaetia bacterium]
MSESSMVSNEKTEFDENEVFLRPKLLKDFQGQSEIKDNLNIFIQAAKQRKETLDHVFISGPPGLGKTTLASIIANEMENDPDFKATSAPALDKPKDLAGILTTLQDGSVFFIDEIHRLKPALEEMLYIAIEDFELDWIIGQGPSARTVRIPLPRFTLIGATTKAGQVTAPLYTRFGINFRIGYYNPEELTYVLKRSSKILKTEIDEDAIEILSKCSRGTPRVANRLLRRLRDYAQIKSDGKIHTDIVHYGLEKLGIDRFGLEEQDRKILQSIIGLFEGGPVGAETLAISVGEAIESLEDFYEPYMIQQGFLKRTPRGRVATRKAYELIESVNNEIKKGNDENQGFLF